MIEKDINALINLRNYVISSHNALSGRHEPSAMTKERDVAITLANIIKGIDELLSGHVSFKNAD